MGSSSRGGETATLPPISSPIFDDDVEAVDHDEKAVVPAEELEELTETEEEDEISAEELDPFRDKWEE